MADQLSAAGLPFERFPGVDGAALGAARMKRIQHPVLPWILCGRGLSAGELGCALSHLRLIGRIAREGYAVAVVMEDDCTVDCARLKRLLSSMETLPPGWDIALLSYLKVLRRVRIADIAENLSLIAIVDKVSSTGCYLISASGARKLSQVGRIPAVADCWPWLAARYGLNIYGTSEALAVQTFSGGSLIDIIDEEKRCTSRTRLSVLSRILRVTVRKLVIRCCLAVMRWRFCRTGLRLSAG